MTANDPPTACALCSTLDSAAVRRVVHTPELRVVRVLDTPAFPAFYRVIWNAHVAEFSQLSRAERNLCMDVVAAVERAMLAELRPAKINLASLGNVVPHLHWHLIARFHDDSHFPQPIWGAPLRPTSHALSLPLSVVDGRVAAAVEAVRSNLG